IDAVESADGVRRLRVGAELRERESARAPGGPVDAEPHAHAGIHLDEKGAYLLLRRVVAQVPNEDRGRNDSHSFRGERREVTAEPRLARDQTSRKFTCEANILLANTFQDDVLAPAAHHPFEAVVTVLALEQARGDELREHLEPLHGRRPGVEGGDDRGPDANP